MVNVRLKIAMLEAGISAKALARRLGVDETAFSKFMHGRRDWRAGDPEKIAAILRRNVGDLFPDPAPPRRRAESASHF